MSERIIIVRNPGEPPRFILASHVVDITIAPHSGAVAVIAEMTGATPPRLLCHGLDTEEAIELWEDLRDWYGHRGGLQFDVAAWREQRKQLATAGTRWRSPRG